jgi:hypothetical protein
VPDGGCVVIAVYAFAPGVMKPLFDITEHGSCIIIKHDISSEANGPALEPLCGLADCDSPHLLAISRCASSLISLKGTIALLNIEALGSELGGTNTWKLQRDLGNLPTNDSPKWNNT